MPRDALSGPRLILEEAVRAEAFPAAAIEVGKADGVIWRETFGRLTYDADSPPADESTLFDLASLTKVIATTTLAMQAIDAGRFTLREPIARWLPDWRGEDREDVTISDLLGHASGLTDYLKLFETHYGRQEFERAISITKLEYPPRTQAIYSDLGFILLGFIIADAAGLSLAQQFDPVARLVGYDDIGFAPPRAARKRAAPTEFDKWRGRLLQGEVHDENANALGGVAGHAGLFGTVGAVGGFARLVLQGFGGTSVLATHETFTTFVTRTTVPGSSRALGWDTMLPTSSCGTLMSPRSIGHTGFTGTSLWVDPSAGVYVVLLTNRVHPSRDNQLILKIRPALHDAILRGLEP